MAEVVAAIAAVKLGVAVSDKSVAEGTNGLASTLRADPTAVAGGRGPTNRRASVEKTAAGRRSGVILKGFKPLVACEAGMPLSVGVDLVRGAVAREGV